MATHSRQRVHVLAVAPPKKSTPARASKTSAASRAPSASASPERKADVYLVERTVALLVADDAARAKSERGIGEHVLDVYFGGDANAVASKKPTKPMSFALLAKRAVAETRWDEDALRRAVKSAIAWRSLSAAVRAKLTGRQLFRLSSVDDIAKRRALAARIASGALKGKAVEAAIAAAGATERRGGRAPEPAAKQLVTTVERALDATGTDLDLDALADATRKELAKRLQSAAKRLVALAKRIDPS